MKRLSDFVSEMLDGMESTGHSELIDTFIDSVYEGVPGNPERYCDAIADIHSMSFPKMGDPFTYEALFRSCFYTPQAEYTPEFSLKMILN